MPVKIVKTVQVTSTRHSHELQHSFSLLVCFENSSALIVNDILLVEILMSDMHVCMLQKRKGEPAPLVNQVSPAPPVPSIPTVVEPIPAPVFPPVRETNTFKSREDHEPLSSVTTVKVSLQ